MVANNRGRVITLSGAGGVGKTRLAIEAARQMATAFDDGVAFVSLASVTDPALVPATIAQSLNIVLSSASLPERIGAILKDKRLLLVLDNFEHLVDAAPLVSRLQAATSRLSILVTSRVRLRLSGEVEYPVPALDLPAPDDAFDLLHGNEAIRLFADRARAIDPGFTLTEQNAGIVAEICRRLDGLPLAVELVASRLRILPVAALLDRLEDRLPLLSGGSRDLPQRQQSMRDSIAWSYDLLNPVEQRLLQWLAVFVGGISLDAAEAAGAAIGIDTVATLETVTGLVESGLLQRGPERDGEFRFRMLETIREYGLEQLAEAGEIAAARMHHVVYFMAVAGRNAHPPEAPEQESLVRNLLSDHDNLIAAFDAACQPETGGLCLKFAAAIGSFWFDQQRIHVGWPRMRRAIEIAPREPTPEKSRVLYWASGLAKDARDFAQAAAWGRECLAVARALGDRTAEAAALVCLAWQEETQEHWEAASEFLDQALALSRDIDNSFMQAQILLLLGGRAYAQGDVVLARTREEEAAKRFEACGAAGWHAGAEWYLGFVAVAEGKLQQAALHYETSLRQWLIIDYGAHVYKPLLHLADIAAACGSFESAARLMGAAEKLLGDTGAPRYPFDEPAYERATTRSRNALGDTGYEAAYASGRATTPDEWITEAEAIVGIAEASAATNPSTLQSERR
jgi:non-specific serine/threonine protein kinase